METAVLFHGTDGDSILGIIDTGAMRTSGGKIFFSKYRWEDSLMHGADSRRKASFVIKVSVSIPKNVVCYNTSTPGVPVTYVVETTEPLKAEVLELYARRPTDGGFESYRLVGADAIRSYLS